MRPPPAGAAAEKRPEIVAAILIHGIQGVLHHSLVYEESFDRERILAAAKHVVRRTLGAH